MRIKNIIKLFSAVVVCQITGVVGSIFTRPSIPTWYSSLQKPDFTPPDWLFAPVWITLYTLMGISAYLVWNKGFENKNIKISLFIFAVQLLLNALWSFLFFGLHSPLCAFIEIIILWVAIAIVILYFLKISLPSGFLLLPYLLWVSFAVVLNFYIMKLNP